MSSFKVKALIAVLVLILSAGNGFKFFHLENLFDSETSLVLDFEPPQFNFKILPELSRPHLAWLLPVKEIPSGFTRSAQLLKSFNISLPPPT